MTSPLSRAEQARDALAPGERAKTVASYLARANQRGVSETYLPEGAIILTAAEAETWDRLRREAESCVRLGWVTHGLAEALALLSAGQPEQAGK